MKKKNLIPQSPKPVVRFTQGTSAQIAELSEEIRSGTEGITQTGLLDLYGRRGFWT